MKTVLLVRHAKSSWDDPDMKDFDRPLNKRGKRDAPFMGSLLAQKNFQPELIVASPAKRTLITAQLIAAEIEYEQEKILTDPRLYEESFNFYLDVIKSWGDQLSKIMLVGHNPIMTSMINYLANYGLENLPTGAMFCAEMNIDSWSNVSSGLAKCYFYEYPKKYLSK
ncbi:putative phosphohistidine phosphatase, SixA [Chloroherpeton thalassium ATCC 35110]|uniref:Putative phosphohistidine phosphatase, SixA n=1 Tax=Chloroherpeton thalassium (strain ATCC 35110 / GB-78) TaxID=517418 RepID=B3QTW7_CHLT3|nr:histidine phosphatase family protein [Chloroherpeton thalassium]ACF14315.1 putative phosphohistidine phosphatase, SixA [Chloroherpeton thalassium ATCC 35110]